MISYVADNAGLLSRRKYRCNTLSPHTGRGKRRRNAATLVRMEREREAMARQPAADSEYFAAMESVLQNAADSMGDAAEAAEQAKRERKNAAARARRAKAKLEAQARAEVIA